MNAYSIFLFYIKLKSKQDYRYYLGIHSEKAIKISKGINRVRIMPERKNVMKEDGKERTFKGSKQ